MAKTFKYGTGKRPTSPAFVEYMEAIVSQAPYNTMPALRDDRGKINWQVSSGTGTSFFRHYNARVRWWTVLADKRGLEGKGNSNDRFTIAARQIHPTGLRPCRICGEARSIFFSYVNKHLAKKLTKLGGSEVVKAHPPISLDAAAEKLKSEYGESKALTILGQAFEGFGVPLKAWKDVDRLVEHLKFGGHRMLSPGFMANCPDRLDGFHDIALCCRASFDPGRSEENLRSYGNDRRAFQWWAYGDWKAADALFNAAEGGVCYSCKRTVERISPDHVGPLACGFLHRPAFIPLCKSCNSSKNRRMSLTDITHLIAEEKAGERVIGWQAKRLWDLGKVRVHDDTEAVWLSHKLRALQHHFLRVLHDINAGGYPHFLVELIPYEFAFQEVELTDFVPLKMTGRILSKPLINKYTWSKACRIVRIAFEELSVYAGKGETRKVLAVPEALSSLMEILDALKDAKSRQNGQWVRALAETNVDFRHIAIEKLLREEGPADRARYVPVRKILRQHFDAMGEAFAGMPNKLFPAVDDADVD